MGKDGILETIQPGALLIDSSTIDPSVSQEVAAAALGMKSSGVRVGLFSYPYPTRENYFSQIIPVPVSL